jgi:vacuolar-type H+-ATPase subunit F/Vma7
MMKGEQQKIYHKGSNRKINAFITLLYPSNKIKFKISKSRTSADFINHLRSIGNYIKKDKIKRFILVTDNATFHVSRKTKQFIENQLPWLNVIFLPKSSPNLNPVETRINRNLKKDVCATITMEQKRFRLTQ